MSETLTFIIPVRHFESVNDWNSVCDRLSITLNSIAAQSTDNWRCFIVANRGSPLPVLPDKTSVVWIDLPLTILPAEADDPETFYNAFRMEKGSRVLAGLMAAPRGGFAMIVDYDDLVSCKLAALVQANPGANGWYLDSGWVYDGGHFIFRQRTQFNEMCGTSHIVRTALYRLPERIEDVSPEFVRRKLGSHRFIAADLRASGTPLTRLPLDGAIYRVGYAGTSSGSGSMFRQCVLRRKNLNPLKLLQACMDVSVINSDIRRNYFAGKSAQ